MKFTRYSPLFQEGEYLNEGHLFISILAYHLLNAIEQELRNHHGRALPLSLLKHLIYTNESYALVLCCLLYVSGETILGE
ncbi:MAG: hypothetical protein FD169_2459 [Bacillota bacterium]|nr:MAG: hypothetical protein FD169_2459 [Bacillota bacterium]